MSEKSEELSTEYRQRVVEEIVQMRSGSMPFFSSTAEVCQICGEVGYVTPKFGHRKIRIYADGVDEFVHGKCREGSSEETSDVLRQQPYRFCEFCRKQFEHAKNDHFFGSGWICPECIESVNAEDPQSVEKSIENIRGRRFLEPKSTEELRAQHINMAVHKLEWDTEDPLGELGLGRIERLRRQATLEKRLNALLRQLAAFHGIEESLLTGEVSIEDDEFKNLIAKEGDIWTITFRGNSVRLGDLTGLTYIVYLLQHPNESISATQLVEIRTEKQTSGLHNAMSKQQIEEEGLIQVVNLGDSGEAADPKTRKEVRTRLLEIEEEKMEAERLADSEKYDELEEKTEQLKRYLSRNYGQGNRPRRAGSHADRMRVNVNRAIQRVVGKIRKQNEALAAYLKSTIKTGYQVSYTPDPNNPVSWIFNIS